jgi:THO complex subunit 1
VLLLRARIHLFIAEWFKLNDMSGVNLRGEYSEMRTRWPGLDGTEEDDEEEKEAIDVSLQSKVEDAGPDGDSANPVKEEAVVAEGDLFESQGLVATTTEDEKLQPVSDTEKVLDTKQSDRMEVDLPEEPVKVDDQGAKAEDLYTALYHVQMVFTSPPSLIGNRPGVVQDKAELPMEAFKRRTGIILEEMAKRRAEAIEMAKSMREAALAGNLDDSKNDEYPAWSAGGLCHQM